MSQRDEETALFETECEKDLGVYVDNELKFSGHCEKKVNQANKLLGLIRRSFRYLDGPSLGTIFRSEVLPHLEYCHPIWSPRYARDCQLVENVQRRAAKLVPALRHLSYPERLERLNLPSLYYRRARGDLVEVYKHLRGHYSVECPYLELADARPTRGHSSRLKKPQVRKTVRANFFGVRVVNSWNNLPESVVTAPSVSSFKRRLDQHWSRFRYIQEPVHAQYLPTVRNRDVTNRPSG